MTSSGVGPGKLYNACVITNTLIPIYALRAAAAYVGYTSYVTSELLVFKERIYVDCLPPRFVGAVLREVVVTDQVGRYDVEWKYFFLLL